MKLILITLIITQIDSSVIEFKEFSHTKCNALYICKNHYGERIRLIDSNGRYEVGDSILIKK